MLQIDVVTIFPALVQDAINYGLLGKAHEAGLLRINSHDLRDFTTDKHRSVDDIPYGGGPGMVMRPEPMVAAIEAIRSDSGRSRTIMLSPRGALLTQQKAHELAGCDQLVLICGRYEGVDERVLDFVDEELSIGDYILAGGEFAALVVIDAVSRLIPGVVGDPESLERESLIEGLLEYPQYTRPRVFRGHGVPDVLLNGHHAEIEKWRHEQAERLTRKRRPDLLKEARGNRKN